MDAAARMRNTLRRLMPRSLRRQFILAVTGLALLILAGGATTIYALHANTNTTRVLVEERMGRMQDAQDLVRHTLLIERESYQLANAESSATLQASYTEIDQQLAALDRLVDKIAAAGGGDDIAVLDLQHSSQLFRNTANIVAQLRENELQATSNQGSSAKRASMRPEHGVNDKSIQQFRNELSRQTSAMVASAQAQSDHFTQDFLAGLQELAQTSAQKQHWVTLLLAGSLLLAWLVAHELLGKHVIGRLQLVSRSLRQNDFGASMPTVLVQGDDEIGEMARSVEQFQKDRWQLAQRTAQLEASNKERDDFSYSMSHDMRTPLRALDGFSHILMDEYAGKLDEEGKRLISVVLGNTQRMSQLIDDILKFSRTGRFEMTLSEIDMEKMARGVVEELRPTESGATMQFEIEHLPPVWGDSAMLRQVFMNLLSNAIKFSHPNATPKIAVGGYIEEGEAVYYVRDNGVGFDMRFANKLFGVFQRLHSINEFEGTGIGLAIVKRIITRHGGRVWAEGKLNEGATIYFSLPCANR